MKAQTFSDELRLNPYLSRIKKENVRKFLVESLTWCENPVLPVQLTEIDLKFFPPTKIFFRPSQPVIMLPVLMAPLTACSPLFPHLNIICAILKL